MSSGASAWKKAHDEVLAEVRKEEGRKKDLVHAWLTGLKFPILLGLLKDLRIPGPILQRISRIILYKSNLVSAKREYYKMLYGEYPAEEKEKKPRQPRKNGDKAEAATKEKPFTLDLDVSEIRSIRESMSTLDFQVNMVDNVLVAMEAEITPYIKFPVPELVEEHKPREDATELSGTTRSVGGVEALVREAERREKEENGEAPEAAEGEG